MILLSGDTKQFGMVDVHEITNATQKILKHMIQKLKEILIVKTIKPLVLLTLQWEYNYFWICMS